METERSMASCCQKPIFQLIEELGHTESVDWDLGRCGVCGSHLLRQWSEYAPGQISCDKLSEETAAKFAASSGAARRALLKDWYNSH